MGESAPAAIEHRRGEVEGIDRPVGAASSVKGIEESAYVQPAPASGIENPLIRSKESRGFEDCPESLTVSYALDVSNVCVGAPGFS